MEKPANSLQRYQQGALMWQTAERLYYSAMSFSVIAKNSCVNAVTSVVIQQSC